MFLKIAVFVMTLSPGDDEPVMMMGDVMWYHYKSPPTFLSPLETKRRAP